METILPVPAQLIGVYIQLIQKIQVTASMKKKISHNGTLF